jgi:serine/threonine protein kinase/tetratricopeptide (TPR) repeat protein
VPLSSGDSLDHYVIEALLGEGGMGAVYRAFDTRLERRVALKILRPASDARPGASTAAGPTSDGSSKLLREARAAAALDHPNATAIFDVGEVDGVAYIAMELVDGRSLRAYVGDKSIPVDRRIRWLVDIGNALTAAHERGLVHRDVKPENVIVRNDGVVKVLDFGIARRVNLPDIAPGPNADGLYPTLTESGLVLGTPHYMAPEQLRGEPVDGRADQFSWGVVAFELLTGKLPWSERTSGVGLVSEILSKDPPPMQSDGLELPAAAEATIRKALSKSARDRFTTIDDAVAALEPYGAASSSRQRRIDSTEPPPPILAGSNPTSGSLPGPAMVSAHRKTLAERPPRRRLRVAFGAAIVAAVAAGYLVTRPTTMTPAPMASDTPSASGATVHTAITDLPPPHAANGEAAAAYLAGVQGIRDASFSAATTNFERARTLDPALASAHLKLAWLYESQGDEAAAHVAARRAIELSSSLDERDRALLSAIEPLVVAVPSDVATAERKLTDVSTASPQDAELAFVLARVRQKMGDRDGARAALDRAIADDPSFAAVDWARGVDAEDAGDAAGAVVAYTRCLETSPSASSCLRGRSLIAVQRGDCAAVEADARRMLAAEPSGWRAYEALARALVARNRPIETVREALKREWLFVPDGERGRREQIDEARLAVLQGDLAGAEGRLRDLEKLGPSPDADESLVDAATLLVAIYDEEGDARHAGLVAHEALATRDRVPPTLLAAAARSGALSSSDLEAKRDAWVRAARADAPAPRAGDAWLTAYAQPAETPDEARTALGALAWFRPPPLPRDLAPVDALYGKVLLLAGRIDDALPRLRAATAACLAFDEPFAQTRAFSDLGRALEATGDKAGACDAYATVLARWGHASPHSVTAAAAAARSRSLACPKP